MAKVLVRLKDRGWELPAHPPAPAGRYQPFRLHNGLGFLASQTQGDHPELKGRVGDDLTVGQAKRAARTAALNALARIREALGGFERLTGLLHVAGHVASAPGFHDQPEILDAASEVFLEILGTQGEHSRTAYAPQQLPRRHSVVLEITFAYHD